MAQRVLHFAILFVLCIVRNASAACSASEWVDPDTPPAVCNQVVKDVEGNELELVFSDEFNVDGRTFKDGDDAIWTGLTSMPDTNHQINAYFDSEEFATTSGGNLKLRAEARQARILYDHGKGPKLPATASRSYVTPMLQSWNKMCYTEGKIELRAKLPGNAKQNGLWPAFWLMGNLGRATVNASTTKLWPWSYNYCPEPQDEAANQHPRREQEINRCKTKEDPEWARANGLNLDQGRGACEIDIIEAMPGPDVFDYFKDKVETHKCPPILGANRSYYDLVTVRQPLVMTSLQLGPGIPCSDKRPKEGICPINPDQANCLPTDWNTQWYKWLQEGNTTTYNIQDFNAGPNIGFWGAEYTGYMVTDALSGIMNLPSNSFDEFHTYELDWKAGDGGRLYFSLDGKKQYQLFQEMITQPVDVLGGTLQGRQIPEEALYVMFNIDMSKQWGWPGSGCVDCHNPECVKNQPFLQTLCPMLDKGTFYEVDYLRIWQRPGATNLACNPEAMPTEGWIENHKARYNSPISNEPLKQVLAGGYPCATDDECGGHHSATQGGFCDSAQKVCKCHEGSTGPRCRSRKVGVAKTCAALEPFMVGGAACFTDTYMLDGTAHKYAAGTMAQGSSDCGASLGRGRCMLTQQGGEVAPYFFDQTQVQIEMEDGSWMPGGSGNGRCLCAKGWGGPSCSYPTNRTSCAAGSCPDKCPHVAWSGVKDIPGMPNYQTLDTYIKKLCSAAGASSALQKACSEVLWSPEGPNTYVQCGYWAKATYVANHATCDQPPAKNPSNMVIIVAGVVGAVVCIMCVVAGVAILFVSRLYAEGNFKSEAEESDDAEESGPAV